MNQGSLSLSCGCIRDVTQILSSSWSPTSWAGNGEDLIQEHCGYLFPASPPEKAVWSDSTNQPAIFENWLTFFDCVIPASVHVSTGGSK